MSNRLLDFSNLLADFEFIACPVMDSEEICVIPKRLGIHSSEESGGTPVFRFEAIHGITPFSKPKPYGLFEIQLSPGEITRETAINIRDKWPDATFFTPDFSSGYLGLSLIASDGEQISGELEKPVRLTNLPLSRLRFVQRVSMDYLKLVKEALHKELILLKAYGLFSVKGYSPKLPVNITFNPEELTQTLLAGIDSHKDGIPFSSLQEFFEKPLPDVPVRAEFDEEPDQANLTATLVDWYSNRFCTIQPPSLNDDEVKFSLNDDATTPGSFTWDLSQPTVVERFTHFTFDALEAARRLLKEKSVDELFTTSVVEPVPTGFLRVEVFHPFFEIPVGIRQVGIKLSSPPNPPLRVQAIHKTIVFDSGQGKRTETLQFSSSEEPLYRVTPFAIYGDHEGTKEVSGEQFESREKELVIEKQVFPFRFITFACSSNILALATLRLEVKNSLEGATHFEPIVLDSNRPTAMFALPAEETSGFVCEITAADLSSDEKVTSIIPMNADYKIDLTTFKEYGSHQVTIRFDGPENRTVALDLLPAHLEADPENITTIAFHNDKREATWSWFAPSFFRAGFRYRFHKETEDLWSEVQSPFVTELNLEHQQEPI